MSHRRHTNTGSEDEAVVIAISLCPNPPPLGFLSGLFNGFTVVFSLIGSIFYNVRIYAYPNSGGWYDFGFVLGVVAFFSVAPLLRTKSPATTTRTFKLGVRNASAHANNVEVLEFAPKRNAAAGGPRFSGDGQACPVYKNDVPFSDGL
jgi:hypothetical protein